MKGYKIFNPVWECHRKQYACPGEFEEDCEPIICKQGMHFCKTITECTLFKGLFRGRGAGSLVNKIAEVEAYGDIVEGGIGGIKKYATNKLRIVREISITEMAEIVKQEIDGNDFMSDLLLCLVCPTLFWASDHYYGFQWFYDEVLGIKTYGDFCREIFEAHVRLDKVV